MTRTLPHLERVGDRWVIPVDADLLRATGIDPEASVTIDTVQGHIVVSSASTEADRRQRLAAIAAEMDQRYGRMMQRLAQ